MSTFSSKILKSFEFADAPVCKSERSEVVGVSKGERVSIKCELDSDPEDVSFRWDLASSGQMVQVPPSRYTMKGASSILHYAPISNLDYGSLFCRGTNHVGVQMAPCVFQIVAAGKAFSTFTRKMAYEIAGGKLQRSSI